MPISRFDSSGLSFGLLKPGDTFTTTITSCQDGLVSGTLSGSLSLGYNLGTGTAPARTEITEGRFTNVKVHYR